MKKNKINGNLNYQKYKNKLMSWFALFPLYKNNSEEADFARYVE